MNKLPDHPGLAEYQREVDEHQRLEMACDEQEELMLSCTVAELFSRTDDLRPAEARKALRQLSDAYSLAIYCIVKYEEADPS